MPKSSKKKKDKVADFSKAKLKLGKGKAQATNAIDTSFKARSIALPSQSIAIEKDTSEPLTKRQLGFGDLISHLKHYNAGTRKDTILGLKELFDSNWDLLDSCLTPLLSALVRLIGDEDAGVRKQLLAFFAWLLPKVPSDDLSPHTPLLLLFTTSAQTHIFPEIRIDAIRFLDILLECIPETVITGWNQNNDGHGSRVLGGYLGILNAGTKYGETAGPMKATSTASVVLTPASKLVVLRSLSTFLRLGLLTSDGRGSLQKDASPQSSNKPLDAWFMSNAFSSINAFNSFDGLFRPSGASGSKKYTSRTWQAEVEPDDEAGDDFIQSYPLIMNGLGETWTLSDLTNVEDLLNFEEHGSESTHVDFVAHLANTLHSTIIETYLDCAPSVFSPSSRPSETELQLVLTVARIARSLYQHVIQSSQKIDSTHIEHLESIVNYMAPYFPASDSKDIKVEQAFEEFNLIFCELTSFLVNASDLSTSRASQSSKVSSRKGKSAASSSHIETDRVSEYIICRLRGQASPSSVVPIPVPITPSAYTALLPTVWVLISNRAYSTTTNNNELLHAVLDHALNLSSKSSCKRLTAEFIGRLFLLESKLSPSSSLERDPAVKAKFEAWFLHLPQVLWELGSNNIPCTEIILLILLRALQRRAFSSETIAALESRLTPYFHIDHPSRGPLPGPFKKLPIGSRKPAPAAAAAGGSGPVRRLALDVVTTLLRSGKGGGKEAQALSGAVGLAVAGEDEANYWEHLSRPSLP